MPGFNPDKINIHDLAIEEPENAPETFDAEKVVTPEIWEQMMAAMECYREEPASWIDFAGQAAAMKIICPERDVVVDDVAWQKMKREMEKYRLDLAEELPHFYGLAMHMKILDPERSKQDVNPDVLGAAIDQVLNLKYKQYREDEEWDNFSSIAMAMKILNPKIDLNIDEETWQGMKSQLELYRSDVKIDQPDEDGAFMYFSQLAMKMKIICPQRADELNLDQDTWARLRDELEEWRPDVGGNPSNWQEFTLECMRQKILAAEKVEVTDNGLEITMPEKKFGSEAPSLPETKQF